jgi:hypothetical protein
LSRRQRRLLFIHPLIFIALSDGIIAISGAGNYVASFIVARLDSARVSRDAVGAPAGEVHLHE